MALFEGGRIGGISVKNRFVVAPLTRCRATPRTHVPTPLMAEYYAQRAGAGLIICEATMVADNQSAFYAEPGIYNEAQVAAWRAVTEAVHAKGGKIILQLWHGGRSCIAANGNDSDAAKNPAPVAPSAIALTQHPVAEGFTAAGQKVPHDAPRELAEEEIPGVIEQFVAGARNAIAAGFDGVEVHGANGYLVDEFWRASTNKRAAGRYSGATVETRSQFAVDVMAAVAAAVGAERVGIRLSPLNSYHEMADPQPEALTRHLCERLSELGVGFVHVMRRDMFQAQAGDALRWVRDAFRGSVITNMGYTADDAEATVASGAADAVAFGTLFMANPDLPLRVQKGAPLNAPDFATAYRGGAKGYTDYPTLVEAAAAA